MINNRLSYRNVIDKKGTCILYSTSLFIDFLNSRLWFVLCFPCLNPVQTQSSVLNIKDWAENDGGSHIKTSTNFTVFKWSQTGFFLLLLWVWRYHEFGPVLVHLHLCWIILEVKEVEYSNARQKTLESAILKVTRMSQSTYEQASNQPQSSFLKLFHFLS